MAEGSVDAYKVTPTTTSSTFGLSKDLGVPVTVKIGYLQSMYAVQQAQALEKYSDPQIFKKLSNIVANSDLYVTVQVFDGPSEQPVTVPIQTPYHAFTNGKRHWDQHLQLPIYYNQLTSKAFIKLLLWELVDTQPVKFGEGVASLFGKDSSLSHGTQKVCIFTESHPRKQDESKSTVTKKYPENDFNNAFGKHEDESHLTELEKRLIAYENGDVSRVEWLDKLTFPKVEQSRQAALIRSQLYNEQSECPYYLFIEFPNFGMPVIYSDVTYKSTPLLRFLQHDPSLTTAVVSGDANQNVLINLIEIPMSKKVNVRVYDPDFQFAHLDDQQAHLSQNPQTQLNLQQQQQQQQQQNQVQQQHLDPVELKYNRLERNMLNNSLLDRELKPSPQIRDELTRILHKPSSDELTDTEKNLIWKFRYYFSKNNISDDSHSVANGAAEPAPTVTVSEKSTKFFFTKFLKSINWDNEHETTHVFKDLIPTYWSFDKIQIGDAVELLGNYFNPFTLSGNSNNTNIPPVSNTNIKDDKQRQIYEYVAFLRKFAVDRLKLALPDELLLYLLQLVQALKFESVVFGGYDTSPLSQFLIEKSIENEKLGNFLYWYVKVENEDQLSLPATTPKFDIYSQVLNKYIEELKKYSEKNKIPNYKHLKRQIWFIKKLTHLVELLRSTFRKNEATMKKVQFLREYLADSTNEFIKFPDPFPLPLDPSIIICGCYPEESTVFKSSLAPLKITFMTITNYHQVDNKRKYKYGKYPLMFKIGDDLRQDQLVIQIINLMDQLLKNENVDLRLTPYKILATSPIAGLIQFVPNETLDTILANYAPQLSSAPNANEGNGILKYLRLHNDIDDEVEEGDSSRTTVVSDVEASSTLVGLQKHIVTSDLGVNPTIMDNYVKSCAGYCVITYLLGVGDRHLDNLLLSPNGKFWHADFGYILGRDPKPFPPLMKLPIQIIDGMGGLGHENFEIFRNYCFITYTTLRKNSNLILNLFLLMVDANIPDIRVDPQRAVEKVEEKFCLEMSEEEAILHFQNLINDSLNAFLPVVIDRLHSLAQYWRA